MEKLEHKLNPSGGEQRAFMKMDGMTACESLDDDSQTPLLRLRQPILLVDGAKAPTTATPTAT